MTRRHSQRNRVSDRVPWCATCHALHVDNTDHEAVFDRLDRIAAAHRQYGRKRGHR